MPLNKITFLGKRGSIHSQKRKVATTLDLANLPAIAIELQILELDVIVGLLTRPLERFGPGAVTQPVADEVGVTLCLSAVCRVSGGGVAEGKEERLTA